MITPTSAINVLVNSNTFKNNSIMKCCICDNENIGEFITINDKKYHLCCIEQLQQENKKYKEVIDKSIKYIEKNMNQKLYTGKEFFETYSPVSDLLNILEEVE